VGDYEFELSKRQKEILQCLKQGASNKVIARQLQLAEATVKIHVKSLLKKLRLINRTQAAIWALEHLPESNVQASRHGCAGERHS